MKKNLVRIVAFVLVALLALTLIPMGALAVDVGVISGYFEKNNPKTSDLCGIDYVDYKSVPNSVTIKTSDYDKYIIDMYGDDYDLKGVLDPNQYQDGDKLNPKSSITFKGNDTDVFLAMLIYTPHAHKLSCWISDGTTHWRNCLVCREKFIYQNWCQDGDEDGICNVCGGDVPYHDVTVIEDEGGKITVNKDLASHRTKITADVEVNEGYKLKRLHFTKIRDDGSRQEITRYKSNGQFWTRMPTYELEVSAEFVKK